MDTVYLAEISREPLSTETREFVHARFSAIKEVSYSLQSHKDLRGQMGFMGWVSELRRKGTHLVVTCSTQLACALDAEELPCSVALVLVTNNPLSHTFQGLASVTTEEGLERCLEQVEISLKLLPELAEQFGTLTAPLLVCAKGRVLQANGIAQQLGLGKALEKQGDFQDVLESVETCQRATLVKQGVGGMEYEVIFLPYPLMVACIFRGLSELQQAHETVETMRRQVTKLVSFDALTGTGNRALFDEVGQDAFKSGKPFGLILLDLDNFKPINDTLGHQIGDAVLQEVVARVQTVLDGGKHRLFRLGGDEFGLICYQDPEACALLCDRILGNFIQPSEHTGKGLSASLGLACAPSDGENLKELYRHADAALYDAKKLGKNSWAGYNPDVPYTSEQLLVSLLQEAIECEDIRVHYQAIVNTKTWNWTSVEALARWNVEGKEIPPSVFIGLAERHGLMKDLGSLILDQVLGDYVWLREQGFTLPLALNLSKLQVGDQEAQRLAKTVREVGLAPEYFVLELTETLDFEKGEKAAQWVEELIALGFGVALDDFGSGFNSLGLLAQVPVTQVKLSQEFIMQHVQNDRFERMVRFLVRMAQAFDVELVAEGVESDSLALCLEIWGITRLQGFYFSEPSDKETTLRLFMEQQERTRENQSLLTVGQGTTLGS